MFSSVYFVQGACAILLTSEMYDSGHKGYIKDLVYNCQHTTFKII